MAPLIIRDRVYCLHYIIYCSLTGEVQGLSYSLLKRHLNRDTHIKTFVDLTLVVKCTQFNLHLT